MEVGQVFYVAPADADGPPLLGASGTGLRRGLIEGVDFQLLEQAEWDALPEPKVEIPRYVVLRGRNATKTIELYPLMAQLLYWSNGMTAPAPVRQRSGKLVHILIDSSMEVTELKSIVYCHITQLFPTLFPELAGTDHAANEAAWNASIRLCGKSRLKDSNWSTLVNPSSNHTQATSSLTTGELNLMLPVPEDDEVEDYCYFLIETSYDNKAAPSDKRNGLHFMSNVQANGWRDVLAPGDFLDAKDSSNKWYEARIVAVSSNNVTVHYLSWNSAKFNETIPIHSDRLAPLHTTSTNWREGLRAGDSVDFCPNENRGLTRDWVLATITRVVTSEIEDDPWPLAWPGGNPRKLLYGRKIELELDFKMDKERSTAVVDVTSETVAKAHDHVKKPPVVPSVAAAPHFGHSSGSYLQSSTYSRPSSYSSYSSSSYSSYGQRKPDVVGVVGLRNLGNTCFLNSVLQCLSNSAPLLQYFLATTESGAPLYESEINTTNPLGMSGKIATAFAKLLQQLWSGDVDIVAPTDLKYVIGEYAPAFAGYNQQDSQEVLSFILDGLHEDLNRVLRKPVTETIEANGRPDAVVAQEAWQQYLRRNDSVITDHFMGQLRSHVTCPVCQHESITFDPYMSLSLPLPNETSILVSVYGADGGMPTQYGLLVPKEGSMGDAKAALSAVSGIPIDRLLLVRVKNHRIASVCVDAADVTDLIHDSAHENVVAYELEHALDAYEFRSSSLFATTSTASMNLNLPSPSDRAMCLVAIQHQMPSPDGSPSSMSDDARQPEDDDADDDDAAGATTTSYRYSSLNNHAKARRIERRLFQVPALVSFARNASLAEIHAKVAHAVQRVVKGSCTERPYVLHVTNTRVDEYLQRHLPESADDGLSADILRGSFTFTLQWTADGYENGYNDAAPRQRNTHTSALELRSRRDPALDLQSCFAKFTEREQLGEKDTWYCPRCKDHVRAFKKFDLFSLPTILLLHLKRFRYNQGHYHLHRDKISTLVRFPISGLDVSEFVVGPSTDGAIYDLYAVSEHSGGLGGGHYTAKAKNPRNDRWYSFNDSMTSPTSAEDAISAQAYVLFYVRRDASSTP
ncbi:hypothetical protein SPRG_06060 [Saprolegnia parasitica CBS 223.65]|uniref:USP domain-containing protein n=1 Tax=Saprolegnia parasitica (strain CBS 223.65) TaxID=695850 RepID=A0A067CDX7_SAPPC|nr:hypothetical protein SPRG_06060 [Saprolegnia parasitica CBS 223.65]KDO28974.1 hypothetical protein SPRG_06060 [Saprolegnia parasitica CBS 223.65]|eukprot:XP_012200175.1 hypothetical protein SPRG_06060 [Saprolegnia parasitica CBS 223.65]